MGPQQRPTVLLVEDAPDDREMYAVFLRLEKRRLIVTGDTAEALALAHTVDVVVTDICLPSPFDGLELVRRLRHRDATNHTPVIVLTACVFEGDRRRALAAGCDAFLPKPCAPDQLLSEIHRVFRLHQLGMNQ
jgi:two-component system, cell cycle response regulator DivK